MKIDAQQRELPMYQNCNGEDRQANRVLMGITGLVKLESIINVLKTRISSDFLEINEKSP